MKPNLSPYAWPPGQRNHVPVDIARGGAISGDSAAPLSFIPPQQNNPNTAPVAVFDSTGYGNGLIQPIVFAAPGDFLALPRPPSGVRTLLVIENTIAGFVITFNYDAPAAVGTGIQIAAGGNVFFDKVVPQNDIHIFSPVAGVVQIMWMIDNSAA